MNPLRLIVVAIIFCCAMFPNLTFAQDNIRVTYTNATTSPDFLNICGDTDEVTVTIGVNGTSTSVRESITASADLFTGIQFVALNTGASSAGVSLISDADPNNPIFSIPDLSPFGVTSVDLTFTILADCNILDTLNQNNALSVFDEWTTDYTIDGTPTSETDATQEYRDALAVPFFNIDVMNTSGPYRAGDCFDRTITVSNSGLAGFVDTLEYTVTQGPGASINAIAVNGINKTIMKTIDLNGDTVVTFFIGAAEFAQNTSGGGPGNGDSFIDPNETVTITESLCVMSCAGNRLSNHEASWGCFGALCNTIDAQDFVAVGDGSANPEISVSVVNPTTNVGYCQAGSAAFTYTNNGVELDPGFATMLDISLFYGLGSMNMLTENGYTITSVTIGGVDVAYSGAPVLLDSNPLFTTDPDGAGGLEDFDSDGFFDDLALFEGLEVIINYEVDCSLGQDMSNSCVNDFTSFLNSSITYSDGCELDIVVFDNGIVRPSNVNSAIENFSSPDAFALGDVFFVTHTESRSIRLFEKNCGGTEVLRATVVLPPGITNVPGQTTLIKNEATIPIPMLSNTVSNDTLTLIFDASTDAFINGNYSLTLAFQADCNAVIGNTVFPTTFEFVCPPCGCEHLWYCGDIAGPFIHKDDAVCPPDPANICPVGIKATGFDVNRTTFGFTDGNYTTQVDPSTANRKVAVTADSVEMIVSGVVGQTAHTGSIGFNIDYTNVDGSTDAGDIFVFNEGTVRINQGGTDFFCPVTTADLTTTDVGGNKNLRFELPNCLTDLGITLNPGDSIQFVGNFMLSGDELSPYETQFRIVPNFRAHPFAVVAGVDEFCETFGDNFRVAKTTSLFAFPNTNNFPTGCEETFLNYQVISVFNDFGSFYGSELYPANKVDSIRFNFDPAILSSFDTVEVMVSIPDHPVHGNNFFAIPPLSDFPAGNYIASFDTLNLIPALNNISSFSFNLRVRVIPNCESLLGSSSGNNIFNFDPTIYYQDRYYAALISDPSLVNFQEQFIDNDIIYSDPPTFSFNNVTNSPPNFVLEGDTAMWTIRLCNTSVLSDAGITWLALDNVDGDIVIEEIVDISDPLNPQTLTFNPYGTVGNNVFAFSDGVLRAIGTTNPEDLCNTYQIKATVTACGELDLLARTGWACQPISDPTWTPEDYVPCDDLTFPLSITTRDPFLDADVEVQPQSDLDICDVNSLTIRMKNTDFGAAFDMVTRLILPEGAILEPGSVEFAYPADAAFVPIATDPVLVSTTAMGTIYEYSDFSALNATLDATGLPGDDLDPNTEDSEFLIRFDFTTDCNFTSGSPIFFNFQAVRGCNGLSNLEAGETLPITIDGDVAGTLKLFDIDFTGGTALVPDEMSTLEVSVTNLTNTPSVGAGDLIEITLPVGVTYTPGTTTVTQPTGWAPGEPAIQMVMGQQILTWPLADGLAISEVATLRFDVSTGSLACDVTGLDGLLLVLTGQNFVCSTNGMVCASNTISSTNGGVIVQFPVMQGILTFDVSTFASACFSPTTEEVTIAGNIINGSMDFPASPFNIEYYNDVDDNGVIDGTDVLIGTFIENGPITANASLPFSHTFQANISDICNILLSTDVSAITGNACGVTLLDLGQPSLLNAGPDQSICQDATTTTLSLGDSNCDPAAYTYVWTAIAPASTVNLTGTTIPNPDFTINMADVTEPSYSYVLETTRPGCTPTTDTIVLTVATPPTVTAMANTPTACPGSSVILTGSGADTYEWFDDLGLSIGNGTSITITPTASTIYSVIGTDLSGCQASSTVTVTLDASVCPCDLAQVTSVVNSSSNCGESSGSATVTIDLDPADYNFVWTPDVGTPSTNGETRTDLPFGGYNIDVVNQSDANCTTSTFALIQNADGPEATVRTTNATCSAPDGTAILSPANFNYTWSNDGSNLSNRTDLASGVYFVTFSDPADPTCENVIAVVIGEDNPLEADATIVAQPDCGSANGEVNITVTGGSGTYTYTWPDLVTGPTRNDLAAGIYVVTIVDQDITMCELPFIFILTDDVPQGTVDITSVNDISCFGLMDGGIEYNVTYDPFFTNPADTIFSNGTSNFTNGQLPAGSYCIQINDGNGCVAGGDCFTIEEPDPLTLQVSVVPDCNNNGTIAVSGVGGTPPYSYDWADLPGADNSSFRQNLMAGLFNIQVEDSNGCTNSVTGIEVQPCPCESVQITSVTILEATCGEADGTARIGLVGDEANFTYTWTPDIGTSGALDNERSELPAGQYSVVIAGNGGGRCIDSISFLVTSVDGLEATFTSTPASCAAADGTVTLSPDTLSYLWPDTDTNFMRSDLAAGTYIVTITGGVDDCPGIVEVTVATDNPLLADVTVTTQPDCGESNGEVTINPTGVAGPFEFLWPDGDTNATRTDLASGLYVVTITDTSGSGCELPYLFVLTDNVPPGTVTINSVDSVSCFGQSDGGVDFSVSYDPGFAAPADTIISDGFFTYENGNLPIGNYCITILDGNGCVAGGECFEVEEPEELELFLVITEDCNAGGSATVTINGGTAPYTFDWSDIAGTDDIMDRSGLLADTLTLTVTDVNGCLVREDQVIIPECSSVDCEFFNGLDSLEVFATSCDGLQELCFEDLDFDRLNEFEIYVDDSLYVDQRGNCNSRLVPTITIAIATDPGPFELTQWEYNDSTYTLSMFADLNELVNFMNTIDTNSMWMVSPILNTVITGGNPDNDYGALSIMSLSTGGIIETGANTTEQFLGSFILIDTGFHEVVFLDTVQMCSDTLTVYMNPDELICDAVIDTIMPLDTMLFCIDTTGVGFTGPITSIVDICDDANGTNVSFSVDSTDLCVTYDGITLGTDTSCIVLCDMNGICDTTNFIVTVVSDTEIVRDTIFPGDVEIFCLDTSIFEGSTFTIDNFCPASADGDVDFFIDSASNCIEYFGNEIGIDSACIEICDELGFCDTTLFYIVVDSVNGGPIAVDDIDTTIINTPIVIDFKSNDQIFGAIDTVVLITDPIYGEASINLDCSLTYDPDNDFCDVTDNFDYLICNSMGCDTATISIYIDCQGEIVIFNAVSPNGDGNNDFFHVGGIDAFPNNRLCIFNRWGNQVFLKEGYNNEFDGRWENKDLPDGTYFYILELNDADERVFKGFFEMFR